MAHYWCPRKFKASCLPNRRYIDVFFSSKAGILMLDNIFWGNAQNNLSINQREGLQLTTLDTTILIT